MIDERHFQGSQLDGSHPLCWHWTLNKQSQQNHWSVSLQTHTTGKCRCFRRELLTNDGDNKKHKHYHFIELKKKTERNVMLSRCCPFQWICRQDEQFEMSYIGDNLVWWAPLCHLNQRSQKWGRPFSKQTNSYKKTENPTTAKVFLFKPKILSCLLLRCNDDVLWNHNLWPAISLEERPLWLQTCVGMM